MGIIRRTGGVNTTTGTLIQRTNGVNTIIGTVISRAGGVNTTVYTSEAPVVNANGAAVYSAFTTGNVVGGTFTNYSYGVFTYTPLTAGSSEEFINQTGTAASVTANYINATRSDTRTCDLDTSAPNGGLPTGTGAAGTCSNPNNIIGATDTNTVTGLARTLGGFTPSVANGGIRTRQIDNDDYEPTVVGPTASISGAASAVRPATISLTSTSTAGDNSIVSEVWSDDLQFIDVNPSTGVVTAFAVSSGLITLTVTDSVGNSDTATHSVSFTNPVAPTIFVSPKTRSISATGGAGVAFSVATTGADTEVTVSGTANWMTVNPDGTWSATENTATQRIDTFRFTVRDSLNQSAFNEVTVSQAAAVAAVDCFMYTFTHGPDGTDGAAIGGYTPCSGGNPVGPTTLIDGQSYCAQEGTVTTVGGSWSVAGASCS